MLMTCRSYSQSQSENHFCPLHVDDVSIKEVLIYCRPGKNQFAQAKKSGFAIADKSSACMPDLASHPWPARKC